MISNQNITNPNNEQVPIDWPYRKNSKMVRVDDLLWHTQIFSMHKHKQRPLFLLIHGTGGAVHSWHKIVESLYVEADLILIDLPGHGFTKENNKSDYSLFELSKLLKKLLITLKIESVDIVIGHSAGAAIAIELCIQSNDKRLTIKHIIGINPSLVPPPTTYNLILNPWVSPLITSDGITSLMSLITQNTFLLESLLASTGSKLDSEQKKLYRRVFSKNNHLRGAIKFMASTDLFELLNRSKNFETNSTFILGIDDLWVKVGPLKKIINRHFPKSKIIENSGGHLMQEASPKIISNQIINISTGL